MPHDCITWEKHYVEHVCRDYYDLSPPISRISLSYQCGTLQLHHHHSVTLIWKGGELSSANEYCFYWGITIRETYF